MLYTAVWADCAVPVFIDDAALKSRVERFLATELAPSTGANREAPKVKLRRRDRRWEFDAPPGLPSFERDDDAVLFFSVALANEFEQCARLPVIHAGAFVANGGAVLYLADLGQGKSVLTFAAWCQGYPILGDDRIALLLEEQAARPLPKCVKLRIDDWHVPAAWQAHVPEEEALIGGFPDDRRWMLSRRLPRVVACDATVPVRAIALLRRVDKGDTHLDEVPASSALREALTYATVAERTPMDLLRFMKAHAHRGRLPRINVAPDQIDEAVGLLAEL